MNDPKPIPQAASSTAATAPARPSRMPAIEQLRGRQLGRILIKMGKLRRSQVHEALDIQRTRHGPIGAILVELGHITEDELNLALAAQCGMEAIDLGKIDTPPEVISLMTVQMANTYRVVPFDFDADSDTDLWDYADFQLTFGP